MPETQPDRIIAWTPAQIVQVADVIDQWLLREEPDIRRLLFRAQLEELAELVWSHIAGHERRRIQKLLTGPAMNAVRCIPNGRIQNGCVVHDGATVREQLRQAYLAAFRQPTTEED